MELWMKYALVMAVTVVLTASVTWRIAVERHKAHCLGDIYVDWTDPMEVECYMEIDRDPNESIRNHSVIFLRVHEISMGSVVENSQGKQGS